MKTSDLYFEIPERLIAQEPPAERGTARLLVLDRSTGNINHARMPNLPGLLEENAIVVFNNSRVRKSRLLGHNEATGGKQEMLLLARQTSHRWEVMGKPARHLRPGARFQFPGPAFARVLETSAPDIVPSRSIVEFDRPIDDDFLDRWGHVPLPPYIHRPDGRDDEDRYQTVFSSVRGSVAAPTAGLHFTPALLRRLAERSIPVQYITLHVGIGTFLPVRAEIVEEHRMHRESFHISPGTAALLSDALVRKRPVVAVGTTVVRALETAFDPQTGRIRAGHQSSELFITPGYRFRAVSHMFTNFHTPRSTLLAMVSAFAGYDRIMHAYAEAIREEYRFFSYGDAMLIV